jgi:predicted metal-dependent HD superfamily phosphohydrolase
MAKAIAYDIVVSGEIMAALKLRYAEPHRRYHTWQGHIIPCLKLFHVVRRNYPMMLPPSTASVEDLLLAIMFHDAVYDPRRSKEGDGAWNKMGSAAFAKELLAGHYAAGVADNVARIIMATVPFAFVNRHSENAMLIHDIDLAVLGEKRREYRAYAAAIRTEYDFLADAEYNQERTIDLKRFLAQQRIYCTRHFRRLCETRARENLTEELRSLQGQ